MNINPIGNGNYYIEIDGAELRDSSVESIIRDGAAELSEGAVYEVYGDADGALVFARARRGSPSFFRFATLDALLAAAQAQLETAQSGECITYLARFGERFWLIFYPWNGEAPPSALNEYSEAETQAHPDFARHLAEHGAVLMGPHALTELARWFAG